MANKDLKDVLDVMEKTLICKKIRFKRKFKTLWQIQQTKRMNSMKLRKIKREDMTITMELVVEDVE